MAIINRINGKKLIELEYKEFEGFFIEHAFFKFMESGRKGLEVAAIDVLDTAIQLSLEIEPSLNANSLLTTEQYDYTLKHVVRKMIDGFVKQGSTGLEYGIVLAQQLVGDYKRSNATNQTKKKSI